MRVLDPIVQRVAVALGVTAVSLWIASGLHLAGRWPDISYHLVGLALLITCFVGLLRADRTTADQPDRQ